MCTPYAKARAAGMSDFGWAKGSRYWQWRRAAAERAGRPAQPRRVHVVWNGKRETRLHPESESEAEPVTSLYCGWRRSPHQAARYWPEENQGVPRRSAIGFTVAGRCPGRATIGPAQGWAAPGPPA